MAATVYYLIRERRLGKKEDDGYFLYKDGEWVPDVRNVIQDHLMGYDPYDDTPYGFGSLSIMDEIEQTVFTYGTKGDQKTYPCDQRHDPDNGVCAYGFLHDVPRKIPHLVQHSHSSGIYHRICPYQQRQT